MNCMSLIGSSARATECTSSGTMEVLEEDDDVAQSPLSANFLGGPLMIEAASKVDKCLARLQNLQGTVTLPTAPTSASASACMSPNFSRSKSCLHGSPSVKDDDKIRIHDVLRWSGDFSGKFRQDKRDKYMRKLSRTKTEVFDDKKDPLDPHGEWKHWSSPAGDVHKVISEILMASQIAKQITSMVNAALVQPDVSSDDGRTTSASHSKPSKQPAPGPRDSRANHRAQSRRKDDPLHKFRVVVATDGPVKKRKEVGNRKELLYPKSKQPVPDRARPADENQIMSSTAKKMQSRRSPRVAGGESKTRQSGWAAKEITNRKSPSRGTPSQHPVPMNEKQVVPSLRRFRNTGSPPWTIVEKPKLSASDASKSSTLLNHLNVTGRLDSCATLSIQEPCSAENLENASEQAALQKGALKTGGQRSTVIKGRGGTLAESPCDSRLLAGSVACTATQSTVSNEDVHNANSERAFDISQIGRLPGLPGSREEIASNAPSLSTIRDIHLHQEEGGEPGDLPSCSFYGKSEAEHPPSKPLGGSAPGSRDASPQPPSTTNRAHRPHPLLGTLRHKFVMEATEIKGANKPWKLNQTKTNKAVLFSNPAFAPASPPGARPPPEKAGSSSCSKSPPRASSATRRVMHRIGRALSAGGRSISPEITQRLNYTRQKIISLSPGRSLPALISKLPSKGKKSSSAPRATFVRTSCSKPAPTSGDLPLPPGRKAQQQVGTQEHDAQVVSNDKSYPSAAVGKDQKPITARRFQDQEMRTQYRPLQPSTELQATAGSSKVLTAVDIASKMKDPVDIQKSQESFKVTLDSKGKGVKGSGNSRGSGDHGALHRRRAASDRSVTTSLADEAMSLKFKGRVDAVPMTFGSMDLDAARRATIGGGPLRRANLTKSRSESHWDDQGGVIGVLSSCRRWVEQSAPPPPGGVAFERQKVDTGTRSTREKAVPTIPRGNDEGGVLGLLSACGKEEEFVQPRWTGPTATTPGRLKRSWSAGSRSFSTGKIRPGSSLLRKAKEWMRTQTPNRDRPHKPEDAVLSSKEGVRRLRHL